MSREQTVAEAGDRAIGFWVKLTSGEATDADHAACSRALASPWGGWNRS